MNEISVQHQQRLAKLRERAAQAIETWQPDPNDSLVGGRITMLVVFC